jgi:hypothetical protein
VEKAFKTMNRETTFSPCRFYRYTLWREWGNIDPIMDLLCTIERAQFGWSHIGNRNQFIQFIGLNPSTADEKMDDPTVRRCINFAKAWGFGGMCMTNLFAFRATDPNTMKSEKHPIEHLPGWQAETISAVALAAGLIVAAWGKDGAHLKRGEEVQRLLQKFQVQCLGQNGDGSPKHPLYLASITRPVPFRKSKP